MDESSFEKKSGKKVGLIIAVIVILLALIGGGVFYFINQRTPENVFKTKVKDAFEMVEKEEKNVKSGRVELELTGSFKSDNTEVKLVNSVLKDIKLNSTTEFDLDKRILNQNITATYDNDQVINIDALMQNDKLYMLLNGLFDKYIDLSDEMEEEELTALTAFFEAEGNINNEKLLKELEEIVTGAIKKAELKQEKAELNGDNVQKYTLKLSSKDSVILIRDILVKLNEYLKDQSLEYTIEDLNDEIEDDDFEEEDYLLAVLYTKGLKNELVKARISLYADDEEMSAIEYVKEDKKATVSIIEFEDVVAKIIIEKNETTTNVKILAAMYSSKLEELMNIEINESNKNEGTIKVTLNIEDVGALTLNIKYKVSYNVNIEERNVSNNVKIGDMTEEQLEQIMTNVENNPILSSIIGYYEEMFTPSYDYDDDYDYYYDDYDFNLDDFDFSNYDFNEVYDGENNLVNLDYIY